MSGTSKPTKERPEWIRLARYTFLQSAPWTPIQECLNEACLAYDELSERLAKYEAQERQVIPPLPADWPGYDDSWLPDEC